MPLDPGGASGLRVASLLGAPLLVTVLPLTTAPEALLVAMMAAPCTPSMVKPSRLAPVAPDRSTPAPGPDIRAPAVVTRGTLAGTFTCSAYVPAATETVSPAGACERPAAIVT